MRTVKFFKNPPYRFLRHPDAVVLKFNHEIFLIVVAGNLQYQILLRILNSIINKIWYQVPHMHFIAINKICVGIQLQLNSSFNFLQLQCIIRDHIPDKTMNMNRRFTQLHFLAIHQSCLQYRFNMLVHPFVLFLDDTTEIFHSCAILYHFIIP